MSIRLAFYVDWDANGSWTEETGIYSVSIYGGRKHYIRSVGDDFQDWQPGQLTIKLRNYSGRYDYDNSGSPLYGKLRPKKRCKLTVSIDGGTEKMLFLGKIIDLLPIYEQSQKNVMITAQSLWAEMRKNYSITLKENQPTDVILNDILDAANWTGDRDIGDGADTLTLWWNENNQTADVAIHRLISAELGQYAPRMSGTFYFRNRHVVTNSLLTLTGADVEQGIQRAMPWDDMKNYISIAVYKSSRLPANAVVWQEAGYIKVAPGTSLTLNAALSYENKVTAVKTLVSPTANTDYVANSAEDGTGIDLTSAVSVSATVYGDNAVITISNTHSDDAYMTTLQLRASKGWTLNKSTTVVETSGDADDTFNIDNIWITDENQAHDMAVVLLNNLKDGSNNVTLRLRARPDIQFDVQELTKITLNIPLEYSTISGDFKVIYLSHKSVDTACQIFDTELLLEPSNEPSDNSFWIFPVTWGKNSIFGY